MTHKSQVLLPRVSSYGRLGSGSQPESWSATRHSSFHQSSETKACGDFQALMRESPHTDTPLCILLHSQPCGLRSVPCGSCCCQTSHSSKTFGNSTLTGEGLLLTSSTQRVGRVFGEPRELLRLPSCLLVFRLLTSHSQHWSDLEGPDNFPRTSQLDDCPPCFAQTGNKIYS